MEIFIVQMEQLLETLVHFPAMQAMNYKDLIMELVWLIKVGVEEIHCVF